MKEALWWTESNGIVRCRLCPHHCKIPDGHFGLCNVRENIDGTLYTVAYARPVAVHADPIEKKPLYHFYPGTEILSVGTIGCNLFCEFCQNWDIARASPENVNVREILPDAIIEMARKSGTIGIAFTYNEPTIFGEYALDVSRLARKNGLKTVMVSNGFITPEAISDIYPFIDAANIDLKSFSREFYRRNCRGELDAVLNALEEIKNQGTFIELTTLIIPGMNDSASEIDEMTRWIVENLGEDTPYHISAFHPSYKLTHLPRTTKSELDNVKTIAKKNGLRYVYEGNVMAFKENNTYCPSCGKLLIERRGFRSQVNLDGNTCSCGSKIPVVQ